MYSPRGSRTGQRRRAPVHAAPWLLRGAQRRACTACASTAPASAAAAAAPGTAAMPSGSADEQQLAPPLEQAVPALAAAPVLRVAVQGDDLAVEGVGPLLLQLSAQARAPLARPCRPHESARVVCTEPACIPCLPCPAGYHSRFTSGLSKSLRPTLTCAAGTAWL